MREDFLTRQLCHLLRQRGEGRGRQCDTNWHSVKMSQSSHPDGTYCSTGKADDSLKFLVVDANYDNTTMTPSFPVIIRWKGLRTKDNY